MTGLILSTLSALASPGIDFDVNQIADESRHNRQPVISETGLAAWSSFLSADTNDVGSDIFVYEEGRATPVTAGSEAEVAHLQPQAQSNSVVWVGEFKGVIGTPNWILHEVPSPQRDEPVPELRAIYKLKMEDKGEQWTESTNPPPDAVELPTNAAPESATQTVVQAAVDTNAPPAQPLPPVDSYAAANEARRIPSGNSEVCLWRKGGDMQKITRDSRDDLGPSVWGPLITWQKAKSWPFGWEIMVWADGTQIQLTTNFYYDMAPKAHDNRVVWYGWDGHDFEIFLYSYVDGTITQITSNEYDDVSPDIWGDTIAWEGYAGVSADIFLWKGGEIRKVSKNIEDDLSPSVWNDLVIWQGFDGDDFEIYMYDSSQTNEPTKLTSNTYDDVNPDIGDGLICWMGYFDNWDAEIFIWDGSEVKQITDNDFEDRDPQTGAGKVIWQSDQGERSLIYLATPKNQGRVDSSAPLNP